MRMCVYIFVFVKNQSKNVDLGKGNVDLGKCNVDFSKRLSRHQLTLSNSRQR